MIIVFICRRDAAAVVDHSIIHPIQEHQHRVAKARVYRLTKLHQRNNIALVVICRTFGIK